LLELSEDEVRVLEERLYLIDGLLALDEVGRLAEDGYRVLVRGPAKQLGRARSNTVGFQKWLSSTEEAADAGYLTVAGIDTSVLHLATSYPSICQLLELPEKSVEGRTIRALKIAGGAGDGRFGILFTAGLHAREILNPDLLLAFALRLCRAYQGNSGLVFGGKSFDAATLRDLVERLDIFVLPLVNPDGREHVQSPVGDEMWRKNRNPNPGQPCAGVDLNRNFDFLWSSGIGTASYACSEVYKGTGAGSEPEVRNICYLLDRFVNIGCYVDVHSYSQLILYPWGNDDAQSVNPDMNFRNPAYDGLRGTPGDTTYKEYVPADALAWHANTARQVRDAIRAVRGRQYLATPGIALYPTTGTASDFAYARHFIDSARTRVWGFTVETATEFQPPYAEGREVMAEVCAGLLQFCVACVGPANLW
jgi:murein tripeptide amidase MpaA